MQIRLGVARHSIRREDDLVGIVRIKPLPDGAETILTDPLLQLANANLSGADSYLKKAQMDHLRIKAGLVKFPMGMSKSKKHLDCAEEFLLDADTNILRMEALDLQSSETPEG